MAGQTDQKLRGDYRQVRADWTVDQDWDRYTPDQHALWRSLAARQLVQLPNYACGTFNTVVQTLDLSNHIPRFDSINRRLQAATAWQLVAVPGLLPDDVFFTHLAARRFPVTVWLRTPEEFDYIVEPDVFHDFFGHVPLLFDPVFADFLQAYGVGGVKAQGLHALDWLARLYWYTVEFGLIRTDSGLRAYGAGILSSAGELPWSVQSPQPRRVEFDLLRIMQTQYKIDTFQETYFVIDSFQQLFDATAPDFAPHYATLRTREDIAANGSAIGDRLAPPNPTPPAAKDV